MPFGTITKLGPLHSSRWTDGEYNDLYIYNYRGARDLPSLKTGEAVHIQLVPNVRKWVPGTIIEITSTRSYKMKTLIGGVYVKNWKFIKIRHTDSRQSLKTTQRDIGSNENNTHMGRPKSHQKATETQRVNELYMNKEHPKKIDIMYKDFISSLSLFIFSILGRVALKAFCQRDRGDFTR